MERIASFQIDHLRLKPGVFVSRRDKLENIIITTFDLRFKEPNKEPVMDQPALHTIEHLCATFMRSNSEWSEKTIYFGPMGCRTGFYLVVAGDYTSQDILPVLIDMFDWIVKYQGDIPGASASECGNWQEQNLNMAKWESRRYLSVLRNPKEENLYYPV